MSLLLYDSAPARLFTAPFRDEARAQTPRLYPVLELAAPSGTIRYAPEAVASAVGGQASARIMRCGSVAQAIDLSSPRLNPMELNVELADTDRQFAALHASYRNSLRGSAATVRVLSPAVAYQDAPVMFSGILDSYEQSAAVWRLRLRTDDIALRNTEVPRVTINRGDWTNAHADALGQTAAINYGTHCSENLSNKGMLPTLYVDTVGFRYVVGIGLMANVTAVYKDGVRQTTGYAITNETRNGRTWTLVDFTADQGSAAITVDLQGLTTDYDGTGDLITNPARQIEHFLANFVFGAWSSGPYLTTTRIDTASLSAVADQLDLRGCQGSLRIAGDRVRAETILERWCQSFGVYPYWTLDGRIAFGMLDWAPPAGYPDFLIKQTDCIGELKQPFDTSQLTREVALKYCYDSAEDRYQFDRKASDVTVAERVATSLEMRDGRAAI